MKIVLFPFSGGNKNSYNKITLYFGEDCKYRTLELRGRGLKKGMPFCTCFVEVVEELKNEIYEFLQDDNDIIFFGHSLGGYLALEVAKLFLHEGIEIRKLVLSGIVPPEYFKEEIFFSNKKDLIVFFENLGGIPQIEKYREELINYVYPLIKMDIDLIKNYLSVEKYIKRNPININLTVLYGEQDILYNQNDIYKWEDYACCPIKFYNMQGNHFFINDNPQYVAEKIIS